MPFPKRQEGAFEHSTTGASWNSRYTVIFMYHDKHRFDGFGGLACTRRFRDAVQIRVQASQLGLPNEKRGVALSQDFACRTPESSSCSGVLFPLAENPRKWVGHRRISVSGEMVAPIRARIKNTTLGADSRKKAAVLEQLCKGRPFRKRQSKR